MKIIVNDLFALEPNSFYGLPKQKYKFIYGKCCTGLMNEPSVYFVLRLMCLRAHCAEERESATWTM